VRSAPRTVHRTVPGPGNAGVGGGIGVAHDAGVDLAADFHVYGVDWGAEQITWRLDGAPYATLHRDAVTMLVDRVRFDGAEMRA